MSDFIDPGSAYHKGFFYFTPGFHGCCSILQRPGTGEQPWLRYPYTKAPPPGHYRYRGGDPDDTQSLIRLLVHSNEFDIEGLVASASGTPGELDTAVVRTDLIGELIRQYEKVYPNLRLHDPAFPKPSRLMKRIKAGNPLRGMDAIGSHGQTEGSRWIAERILHPDERPLNVCIWGGQTDLYQALWHLKDSLTKDHFNRAVSTLRIYDINDQDHIYHFFRDEFPGLFHILAKSPPGTDKREGAYRGMYLGGDESLTSAEWVNEHMIWPVQSNLRRPRRFFRYAERPTLRSASFRISGKSRFGPFMRH